MPKKMTKIKKTTINKSRKERRLLLTHTLERSPKAIIENCEIPFDILLFLIKDRIKWIEQVWSGKKPNSPDKFCQCLKDFCPDCRQAFFHGGVCHNNLRDPLDGKSYAAKNMGWGIFGKTNIADESVPDRTGIKEQFYYELLKDYHYTILAATKRCLPIILDSTANYKKIAHRLKHNTSKKNKNTNIMFEELMPEEIPEEIPEELRDTPILDIPDHPEQTARPTITVQDLVNDTLRVNPVR
jgi:hypothetical protein